MLMENGIHSNGIHNGLANGTHLVCESDYPERPADVTPKPGWRNAFPIFTHSLNWTDAAGMSHGLTLRTDSLDELLETLKVIKRTINAGKQQAAERQQEQPQETPTEPETQQCPLLHHVPMFKRASKHGGHFYSHKLANGDWCNGRAKA